MAPLGYALLPAALSIAISGAHPRKVAGRLGALWGIAGGQAQFLLFFPLVALPLAVQSRRLAAASAGLLLMIAVQLPAIVAMIYAHRLGAFASQQTNLTWQMAQSDPLGLALLSGADPAHYFAHWQGGAAFALSLGIIVCAAIGAFSSTLTRILAATWLLCALWSSGLDGPLAIPIAWTFAHVPEAIALREFAHTQAVVAPLLAILGAHGISRIVGALRAGAWIGAVATFLALLPLTAAAFSGATTGIAIPIAHSSDRDAVVADIEALPGSGQVLWWPGLAPIALRTDATRGGVDSEALVTGEHAPYAEYRPTAALAQAIVALGSGDRAACGLLADLGVQAVIVRDAHSSPPAQRSRRSSSRPPLPRFEPGCVKLRREDRTICMRSPVIAGASPSRTTRRSRVTGLRSYQSRAVSALRTNGQVHLRRRQAAPPCRSLPQHIGQPILPATGSSYPSWIRSF